MPQSNADLALSLAQLLSERAVLRDRLKQISLKAKRIRAALDRAGGIPTDQAPALDTLDAFLDDLNT